MKIKPIGYPIKNTKIEISNEKGESISLVANDFGKFGKISFYFSSHSGDVTSEVVKGTDYRKPIGDNVFRSNPFELGIFSGNLTYNGTKLKDLKIPEIIMNRSTCVFMPVVMITNESGNCNLSEADFKAVLGETTSWKVGTSIPDFPVSFDFSTGIQNNKYVGEVKTSTKASLLIMQNKGLEATTITSKDDKKFTGFAATGARNTFIYWSKSIPYVHIPVEYNPGNGKGVVKKTLKVNLTTDGMDVFNSNTHYQMNFILDYKNVQNAFQLNTKSIEDESSEVEIIPCEVFLN